MFLRFPLYALRLPSGQASAPSVTPCELSDKSKYCMFPAFYLIQENAVIFHVTIRSILIFELQPY